MISAWVVQIVFRLVNFIIISFLFAHVFIKYLYPALKEQLAQYLNALQSCRVTIKKVMQQGRQLDKDIEQQKKDADALLVNIKKWHIFVDKEKEKRQYESAIRVQSIKKIYQKQAEHYQRTLLYNKMLPEVFERATLELHDEYQHDKEKAEKMVGTIFKTIAQDHE